MRSLGDDSSHGGLQRAKSRVCGEQRKYRAHVLRGPQAVFNVAPPEKARGPLRDEWLGVKEHMFWLLLCLLLASALCSWLSPGSALAASAARAFDNSVWLLSQDEDERGEAASPRLPSPPLRERMPRTVARHDAGTTTTIPNTIQKRKRITPYQAKKIAAAQNWRCACGCGQILDASYEIDHKIPLHLGGKNDESNLQALLRTHHQGKTSKEAAATRRSTPRASIKMFKGG